MANRTGLAQSPNAAAMAFDSLPAKKPKSRQTFSGQYGGEYNLCCFPERHSNIEKTGGDYTESSRTKQIRAVISDWT
tara:strand:+ start:3860 stop:4090 length:231 start_codon:yes stop_codon:yes gene_type:complete